VSQEIPNKFSVFELDFFYRRERERERKRERERERERAGR